MSDNSKIEWTDVTWNPVRGCSRVSEGCRNCYAERVAARFSGPGMPYEGLVRVRSLVSGLTYESGRGAAGSYTEPRWNGTVRFVPEKLAEPLHWKKPRRVFVNSMSDLFHDDVTNQQIAAVFGVMAATPRHTYQVLTKRAKRMRAWFEWARRDFTEQQRGLASAPNTFRAMLDAAFEVLGQPSKPVLDAAWRAHDDDVWPLPNAWIGVSVENQAAADERIPELLATPAAVRWISAEPLIGPVDLENVRTTLGPRSWSSGSCLEGDDGFGLNAERARLDWIVMGAESGPGARAADPAWFRGLAEQCKAAGVPVFFKQGVVGGGITAGPESHAKHGGLVGLPLLDGASLMEFPQ